MKRTDNNNKNQQQLKIMRRKTIKANTIVTVLHRFFEAESIDECGHRLFHFLFR